MSNYEYGSYEKTLMDLYGDNWRVINHERGLLWDKMVEKGIPLMFKSIIQNPFPISKAQYNEWLKLLEDNSDDISKNGMKILDEVKVFVLKNHLK